jgi:hypothetical protein
MMAYPGLSLFSLLSFAPSFTSRYASFILLISHLVGAWSLPQLLNQEEGSRWPEAHQQYAPDSLGAVASESSICSNIGIDLLRQGGNAADAVSDLSVWKLD